MNSKELHNLHEAYLDVYQQEVDEAVKGASRHDTEMRKAASTERKSGIKNRLSPAAGKDNADKMQRDVKFFDKLTKKNRNVVGLVTKEEVEQIDEISPEIVLAASKAADKKGKRAQASRLYKKFAARDQAANYAGYQRSSVKKEEVDIFDAILEHLIAEGYADTNESALVIMANMSEEWRQSIVEVKMDPRGRPASGPMNVYANPKGKPDQAHLDAVKAYDAAEKKKTPEQRKKELDDYRERQMNNK